MTRVLGPSAPRGTDLLADLQELRGSRLTEILRRNKVAMSFEESLTALGVPREKMFDELPEIKAFYEVLHNRVEGDFQEFERISEKLSHEGIEFILIKSDGSFPYESDNLDALVKPERFSELVRLLRREQYLEITTAREPNKFLFRKGGRGTPLHIHTRVEWEGTEFVDSRDLWSRAETAERNRGFLVPSPEDCVLVTTAHLFFENHEVRLGDVLKIHSRIRNCDIDWEYAVAHARRLSWDDAFGLAVVLVNRVYESLYGRSMLDRIMRFEGSGHAYEFLMKMMTKRLNRESTPLRIPYGVSALFFVKRVLNDPGLTSPDKVRHLGCVSSQVARRRAGLLGGSFAFQNRSLKEDRRCEVIWTDLRQGPERYA